MPGGRPATGAVDWLRNKTTGAMQWHVRLTLKDGTRTLPLPLDPTIPEHDETAARAAGAVVSKLARERGLLSNDKGETVEEYAKRWLESREGRVRSVGKNKMHLERHVYAAGLRLQAMTDVVRADVERVVAVLDRKVAAGAMTGKSAKNIWGTVTKLFDDATNAKPSTGLRVLDRNPAAGVRGPEDDGIDKALQFLYPSEFLQFVSSSDVSMTWRRAMAIAVYLCLRDGEQRALDWKNVDLEHGLVTVKETYDRALSKDRDGTKTNATRTVGIPAPLLPLLTAMRKEAGGKGKVCEMPSMSDMATGLRRQLRRAGIERDALLTATPTSHPLRWHDLRATGGTWHAVAGRPATEIRDILGHTQTQQTDRYVRQAAMVRGGRFGEPFPELPKVLLDRAEFWRSFGSDPKLRQVFPTKTCEGGDLNPYGSPR